MGGVTDRGFGAAEDDDDLEVDLSVWSPFDDAAQVRERHEAGGSLKSTEQRPKGRPLAATNRKTVEFERWYKTQGYRDPLAAMAQWLTADPIALQAWLAEHERTMSMLGKSAVKVLPSLLEIIKEQHAVAVALAPYLHGKKPVQVQIIDERLPTLIIDLGTNQLAEGHAVAAQQALSAGSPLADEDEEKTQ